VNEFSLFPAEGSPAAAGQRSVALFQSAGGRFDLPRRIRLAIPNLSAPAPLRARLSLVELLAQVLKPPAFGRPRSGFVPQELEAFAVAPKLLSYRLEAAPHLRRQLRAVTAGRTKLTRRLVSRFGACEAREERRRRPGSSIIGSIPGARWRSCKSRREEKAGFAGSLHSPLADSNRRPPPYHGAPGREGRARAGVSRHGNPAKRKDLATNVTRAWTRVVGLMFPNVPLAPHIAQRSPWPFLGNRRNQRQRFRLVEPLSRPFHLPPVATGAPARLINAPYAGLAVARASYRRPPPFSAVQLIAAALAVVDGGRGCSGPVAAGALS
jgi:hypothetical protein